MLTAAAPPCSRSSLFNIIFFNTTGFLFFWQILFSFFFFYIHFSQKMLYSFHSSSVKFDLFLVKFHKAAVHLFSILYSTPQNSFFLDKFYFHSSFCSLFTFSQKRLYSFHDSSLWNSICFWSNSIKQFNPSTLVCIKQFNAWISK